MTARRLRVLLWLLPAGVLAAAPLGRDLGEGLAYLRPADLPGDLPAATPGRPPALVFDVRFLAATEEGATAFAHWLEVRVAQRGTVFVLANSDTSEPLRRRLAARRRGGGVVVIGIPADGFAPDLAVPSTAERERAAFAALAGGTPPAALLHDHPDKVRHDEARLTRAAAGNPPTDAAVATDPRPPAPPTDAALQRAVHLHRALLALRKI